MHIDQIDIRQGTANSPHHSNGNCLPYVGVPMGMNYFVAQTNRAANSWFFQPTDSQFEGIRVTHQPSPWIGDYSHFLVTAVQWHDPQTNPDFTGNYRPDTATFHAHHLAIYDDHFNVQQALTPTTYGAALRYRFDRLTAAHHGLYIQLPDTGGYEITATGIQLYTADYHGGEDPQLTMYADISLPAIDLAHSGCYDEHGNWHQTTTATGSQLGILVATTASHFESRLATSFISANQAQLNRQRISQRSFKQLQHEAATRWNDYLDRVQITDHHPALVQTFYTCLYRLFLFPQRFYELDASRQPVHYDTTARAIKPGSLYTNNGFWDTAKTVYPLFSLLAPELLPKFLRSFLTSYQETGFLPRWLAPDERGMMPGNLVDSIIAECAQKNLATDLLPALLDAMIDSDTKPAANGRYGRTGGDDYDHYGYLPADRYPESVNRTQDYAYSDFCIGQVAAALKKPQLATKYWQQSHRYLNLLDKHTGFMRPKNADGTFKADFVPDRWGGDYTEGSAWQNSFSAVHDIDGLMTALGGPDKLAAQLTALCNARPTYQTGGYGMVIHEMTEMAAIDYGQLAISNQPSFHLPYLFALAGQPAKTQVLIKQLRNLFDASPTGFPGDEDNGSMAGWFIFACLGFYPVCPAKAEYVLGLPAFDEVILHLADHDLTLTTTNNHDHNNFVQQLTRDGQAFKATTISHHDLLASHQLTTRLGLVPAN